MTVGQRQSFTGQSCLGQFVINGVDMITPAWEVVDLTSLWLTPRVRGSDRLIPGINGVRPFKRRTTVTEHNLPFVVVGGFDQAGVALADPWAGLQANIDYLRLNVVDPTGVTDGTRVATLTMPSGAVRTADIHVLGMTPGERVKWIAKFTLDISIPAGGFV